MDKELLAILQKARDGGADESQLRTIIESYNQKKKTSVNGGTTSSPTKSPLQKGDTIPSFTAKEIGVEEPSTGIRALAKAFGGKSYVAAKSNGMETTGKASPQPTLSNKITTLPKQPAPQKQEFHPTEFLLQDIEANPDIVEEIGGINPNGDQGAWLMQYNAKKMKRIADEKAKIKTEILNVNQDKAVAQGDMIKPKLNLKPALVYDKKPDANNASKYETEVTSEKDFWDWLDKNYKEGKIPKGDYDFYRENGYGSAYDFRAAYAKGEKPQISKVDGKYHWSDIGKKPNHPTFSKESKYHNVDGFKGGTWVGEMFLPPDKTTDKLHEEYNNVQSHENNFSASVGHAASKYVAKKTSDPVIAGKMKLLITGDTTISEVNDYEADGLPIPLDKKFEIEKIGLDAINEGLDKSDPDYQIKVTALNEKYKTLFDRHPEYKQKMLSKAIAEQIMKDNPNPNGMMLLPYAAEAAKKLGISDEDMRKIDVDDLPIQSFGSSAFGTVWNSALSLGAGIARFGGTAIGLDKDWLDAHLSETLRKGQERYADVSTMQAGATKVDPNKNSPTYLQEVQNPDAGKYNYNFHTMSNAIGNGVGTLVSIIGGTKGLGSVSKSIAPALPAATATEYGMASTMIGLGYEPYYQKARQDISDDPQDEWKRHLSAIFNGTLDYATFRPLNKLQKNFAAPERQEISQIIRNIPSLKAVTSEATKSQLRTVTEKILSRAGHVVGESGKIGAAMNLAEVSKNIVDNIVGNKEGAERANKALGDNLIHAWHDLPFTMMIPLGMAEVIKRGNYSNVMRENLYNIGLHPETYKGELSKSVQRELMTPEEAAARNEVIDVLHKIVSEIPADRNLNHNQKVKYVQSQLRELGLRDKAMEIQEAEVAKLTEQEANAEASTREGILNGEGKENELLPIEEPIAPTEKNKPYRAEDSDALIHYGEVGDTRGGGKQPFERLEEIPISEVTRDPLAEINYENVDKYSKLETEIPPIEVHREGSENHVYDGNTRVLAAQKKGQKTIKAWVSTVGKDGTFITEKPTTNESKETKVPDSPTQNIITEESTNKPVPEAKEITEQKTKLTEERDMQVREVLKPELPKLEFSTAEQLREASKGDKAKYKELAKGESEVRRNLKQLQSIFDCIWATI